MISDTLSFQEFYDAIFAIEELSEFADNPLLLLAKRSKTAKIDMKFKEFSQLRKFYAEVSEKNMKIKKLKKFKYESPKMFTERFKTSIIYDNKYILDFDGKYANEVAFMRLILVWSQFVEVSMGKSFFS